MDGGRVATTDGESWLTAGMIREQRAMTDRLFAHSEQLIARARAAMERSRLIRDEAAGIRATNRAAILPIDVRPSR